MDLNGYYAIFMKFEFETARSSRKQLRNCDSSSFHYSTPLDFNDLLDSPSKRHKTKNVFDESDDVIMKVEVDMEYTEANCNSQLCNTNAIDHIASLECGLKQNVFLSWKPQSINSGVQDTMATSKLLYLCGCCNQAVKGDELDLVMSCSFCCKKLCYPNYGIHEIQSSNIDFCYRKCELCRFTYCKYCVSIDYSCTFERILCLDCQNN